MRFSIRPYYREKTRPQLTLGEFRLNKQIIMWRNAGFSSKLIRRAMFFTPSMEFWWHVEHTQSVWRARSDSCLHDRLAKNIFMRSWLVEIDFAITRRQKADIFFRQNLRHHTNLGLSFQHQTKMLSRVSKLTSVKILFIQIFQEVDCGRSIFQPPHHPPIS